MADRYIISELVTDDCTVSIYDAAADLHDRGGVPERRAEAVALVVCGFDRAAVVEVLGFTHRATVSQHVANYRDENLPEARWLAEHGPDV